MSMPPESIEPNRLVRCDLPMPRLSDEAVVQIHDFIHHVLDLFEARYGDQIDRFYADLSEDGLCSEPYANNDDPPF
jgi:hypothetical protein